MKRISVFAFLLVFGFSLQNLFAQIKILSPVEGEWANKQMLLIDNANDGEYFYSIDGSDPETFGFAYDGPVLIDVTGDVKLNVSHVMSNNKKESAFVKYTVSQNPADDTSYKDFVQTFYETGIINYSAGSELEIPSDLLFSLGLPPDSYLEGRKLSVRSDCVYSRSVPCTIYDKIRELKYRFVIRIIPQSAGESLHQDVPFKITDWETIEFTDKNLIYKIDSEYWELPKKSKKIDRSVNHMISWQPLEYNAENPVEFFILPKKPELKIEKREDGSFSYSVEDDDSYTLSILSDSNEYKQFFKTVGVDVFVGDRAIGNVNIGIFANSVYQASVTEYFAIDKRPPVIPVIRSTAKAFYSRDKVNVEIISEPNSQLYVSLSEPYVFENNNENYSADSTFLKNIPFGEYKLQKANYFKVDWMQRGENPVFYKVRAYSKSGKNTSQISEYSVIIDQSNFYFDNNADETLAEGTAEHPFTKISQLEENLSGKRVIKLRIKGEMLIDKPYKIESNIRFINEENANLVFAPEGSLEFKGITADFDNFTITNQTNNKIDSIVPFFKLENAVLNLNNCMIAADFSKNGTIIDSYNSIINLSNIISSVTSVDYASFISSVKSRITITKSSISTFAETNVIISSKDGTLKADNNNFIISGNSGRIAEIFGTKANFTSNSFKANFTSDVNNVVPIYKNKSASLVDKDNEKIGF